MKLTEGEARILLMSDCLKYYPDLYKYTRQLRLSGKSAILEISSTDVVEMNSFLSKEDISAIRIALRKEWKFTGSVLDNGKGNRTTCEYCQSQKIRYRYICVNKKTKAKMELGSVCVGNIVYGEEAMKDPNFSKSFVGDLDKLKAHADKELYSEEEHKSRREEQKDLIRTCVTYLFSKGYTNDEFVESLHERWNKGLSLSDKQIEALKNKCKRVREYAKEPVGEANLSPESKILYQKVLHKLKDSPDNEFLKSCKLQLERYGDLTEGRKLALSGRSNKRTTYQ